MIDSETIYKIIINLIGEIKPTGSESVDQIRRANLRKHIEVTNMMIDDLIFLIDHKEDYRSSVKHIGETAHKELSGLREILPEILGEEDAGE